MPLKCFRVFVVEQTAALNCILLQFAEFAKLQTLENLHWLPFFASFLGQARNEEEIKKVYSRSCITISRSESGLC